jgi:hypothetical protein
MRMTRFVFFYFIFLFVVNEVHAQKEKFFSAGLMFSPSVCATVNESLNGYQNSLLGFISLDKNKFLFGADFYDNTIMGFHCAYQYHILNAEKKNHWFAEANIRYVRYGTGYAEPVGIEYFKSLSSYCDEQTVHANALLINTFGFGREFFLSKVFYFNILLGSGITWKQSRVVDCMKIRDDETANYLSPNIMLKLGFGINIYSKVTQ